MPTKLEASLTAKCCRCHKRQEEFGTVVCKNCCHAICACEVCDTKKEKGGRKK